MAATTRRVRRRHVQQDWLDARGERPKSRRGGKRKGAGRKPNGARAGSPHKKRPTLNASHPVHVVLRVVSAIRSLRRRALYKAVREATLVAAQRDGMRIVHVSIQRTHIHLLVEARHRMALARGMQRFQISAAKRLNAAVSIRWEQRRRGQVFADRYHAEIIKTPRQARHALAYVLNNWRKHREDQVSHARTWRIDPFSSGFQFDGWKEREHEPFLWKGPDTYDPLFVWLPKTWLLSAGWRRHGLIRMNEVPGSRQRAPR